jgi:O-antigen ligase
VDPTIVTDGSLGGAQRQVKYKAALFIALCTIIALAPLPLGSARPLAWDILALAVGLLLTASLFLPAQDTSIARERLFWPAVLFGVVVVFALAQTAPWIPPEFQNPLWNQAADTLGRDVQGAIAVDRNAAFTYVLRLVCYVGIFYLALITGRDGSRAHVALEVIAFSGCAYAAYALFVYWSGNKTILWYPKWAYGEDLTGTFVNRNSFATYLGLCTLACCCRLLLAFSKIEPRGNWQRRLVTSLEFVSAHTAQLIMLFILLMALVLTHSRGGMTATFSGITALMLMISIAPSLGRFRRIGRWGMLPFAVFLIVLVIGGNVTLGRLLTADIDAQQRLTVYQLTLQAIGDYPLSGIGLGSFASVFPVYRTAAISSYFDLAHNEYLQNLLELGIPVAGCLFAALGWLVLRCISGVRTRQRDAIFPCLGVAASVLVGLHSVIDFSLQIPAVTVTYMFLLGIGVAQSQSSRAGIGKA